jgi:hypothetical protein
MARVIASEAPVIFAVTPPMTLPVWLLSGDMPAATEAARQASAFLLHAMIILPPLPNSMQSAAQFSRLALARHYGLDRDRRSRPGGPGVVDIAQLTGQNVGVVSSSSLACMLGLAGFPGARQRADDAP